VAYYYMDGDLVKTDNGHNYLAKSLPIEGTGCFLLGMDQDNGICTFPDTLASRGPFNGSMTELRSVPLTPDFFPADPAGAHDPQPSTRNSQPATSNPPPASRIPHPTTPHPCTLNHELSTLYPQPIIINPFL
jgi:hypothetical protein